jgi:hypothetical protein
MHILCHWYGIAHIYVFVVEGFGVGAGAAVITVAAIFVTTALAVVVTKLLVVVVVGVDVVVVSGVVMACVIIGVFSFGGCCCKIFLVKFSC